ncbi:hypothetical protein IFR04_001557 [Cadophora malorum]|uniref:Uncharacterized protein n=1 Tax=Cadophora malorum TaxID=108018 RepID=A0A8H8BVH6_9HELO|nr:hypothetical protein IFR04_001557 [Cadophora malorum]
MFLNITGASSIWRTNKLYSAQFTVISTVPNLESNGSVKDESELVAQPGIVFDCSLSFCAQTLQASVVNGTMIERVLNTYLHYDETATNDSESSDYSRLLYTFPPPTGSHPSFRSQKSIDAMNRHYFGLYFDELFNGSYGRSQHTSDVMLGLYRNNGSDIPAIMDNVANSLSHELRKSCRGRNERGQLTGRQSLNGTVWTDVTLVRIRWEWLILPVAVEVLGLYFFVAVLVLSRFSNAQLWKTSMLAALLHGPEIEGDDPRLRTRSGWTK